MKIYIIDKTGRRRAMIRSNDPYILADTIDAAEGDGLERVGFVGFWRHVIGSARRSFKRGDVDS